MIDDARPVPATREIFFTFLRITLLAFGGAIAWVHRTVVVEKRWLTEEEFGETLSLCQFLPGPNITNFAVVVGMRFRGLAGALAGLAGLIVTLEALATRVVSLALISFGGVNTVLPALHHQAVNQEHWMTDRDFVNLFALASIAPGPNFMVLTLIGYKAAGVLGAIVATMALCIPTSVLAFAVVTVWDRFKTAHWRDAVQQGLLPVTIGFIGAAAVLLARGSDDNVLTYAITGATAIVGTWTNFSPLWVFGVAAVIGAAGLL